MKGVRDMIPRDAIIELWNNPLLKVKIPKDPIPGYKLHIWISKMVDPKQIEKY